MSDTCRVCRETINGQVVNAKEYKFHSSCFLCNQCLEPFPDNSFITTEDGKFYCEADYYLLYGDRCARCGEIIMEKCVNALDLKWHADHFTCENCGKSLTGGSYFKRNEKPYCKDCNNLLKLKDQEDEKNTCPKCKKVLKPGEEVALFEDQKVHAYHLTCVVCRKTYEQDFKSHDGKLYCPSDYARATAPTCYVCKKPIYGRSINAMGKPFHPEHFVCAKCEQPFPASSFFEYQGKPYCEQHYNELAGARCGLCYDYARGKVITAAGKKWCENHFSCVGCDIGLSQQGQKYLEWDGKIMCTKCYDEIPKSIRRKLLKYIDNEKKLVKKSAAMR